MTVGRRSCLAIKPTLDSHSRSFAVGMVDAELGFVVSDSVVTQRLRVRSGRLTGHSEVGLEQVDR